MIVREIQPGEAHLWDAYARHSPFSTPQHLYTWKKVMEDVFHSETHYLISEENGTITGLLPLIHINSLLAGHYLTSQPGGICADNDIAAGLLFKHAREFVLTHKAKYLILRDGRKKWNLPDVVTDEEHITFLNEIPSDLDQLKSSLRKKTRWRVNQATKNGITAALGLENLDQYYPTYARAMQELGTPTLGLDFFKSAATHLPNETNLITLYYGDKIVGGGFLAPFKNTVYCSWSGLLHEHYDLHISYRTAWEAIKYAHEHGYQWVDLGRCKKNSGGHEFKQQFNGQVQQLYQQIYLNGIERVPTVGVAKAADWKFRFFIRIWRILPLPIANALGPILRRQMPFG